MFLKLVKYEFRKGIVPYFIILASIILGAALFSFQLVHINMTSANSETMPVFYAGLAITGIILIIFFVTGFVFNFVQGIMYLADEFFRSKGYLTFSTANSSWKILGSKFFVYFIRIFIYYLVAILVVLIFFGILSETNEEVKSLLYFIYHNKFLIFLVLFLFLLNPLLHMAFIYFLITLNSTVLNFKYKILSTFLMYFGWVILRYIVSFMFQIFFPLFITSLDPDQLMDFYQVISINVPLFFNGYTESVPIPVIPILLIPLLVFFFLYFISCKMINKGINI